MNGMFRHTATGASIGGPSTPEPHAPQRAPKDLDTQQILIDGCRRVRAALLASGQNKDSKSAPTVGRAAGRMPASQAALGLLALGGMDAARRRSLD